MNSVLEMVSERYGVQIHLLNYLLISLKLYTALAVTPPPVQFNHAIS